MLVVNFRYANIIVIVLMLLTVALFTSKSLYNYPVGLMACSGILLTLVVFRKQKIDKVIVLYIALFLCIWIPMLLSLPDAVNFDRSTRTVFSYLRFLFAGLFVLSILKSRRAIEKLNFCMFLLITFWCMDAIFQYLIGFNVFGFPHTTGYVTGIFYPEITIGHISAVLSPLYFEVLRKMSESRRGWPWLLVVPLFVVVLLSGRRAAWVMLAVSSAGYLAFYLRLNGFDKVVMKKLIAVGLIILAITGLAISTNDLLQRRINVVANLFSGDYELANAAIGKRLDLWQTSIDIFKGNWVNGVGPRGFRYVYSNYSQTDDHFHDTAQTHPHQVVLEVIVETGITGAVGLLLFFLLLPFYLQKWKLLKPVFPFFLAVIVCVFPINTHMAFYGSYWSSVFWWLLIVMFAIANSYAAERSTGTW